MVRLGGALFKSAVRTTTCLVMLLLVVSTCTDALAVEPGGAVSILFHQDPEPARIGENKFEVLVKDGTKAVKDADVSLELRGPAPQPEVVVVLKYYGDGIYRGKGAVTISGKWSVVVHVRRGGREVATRALTISTQ